MNIYQILSLLIPAIFVVLFHCMFKCNQLLKRAQSTNANFNWKKDYLQRDALAISMSFLSIGIWFFIYREVATNYAWVDTWKVISFCGVAAFGSYIIQAIFSNGEKVIDKVIDAKTDQLNRLLGKSDKAKTNLPGNAGDTSAGL